jgi:CheY-like chemotaxis protein
MNAGQSILVVDDDPAIIRTLRLALLVHGFTVRLAGGGQEAVDLYRQHPGDIGLVLLDVQMPDMDGPQTLAALQALDPAVRCCFMSGRAGQYSDEQLLGLGAVHVIHKPFPGLADLTRLLGQLAQRPGDGTGP